MDAGCISYLQRSPLLINASTGISPLRLKTWLVIVGNNVMSLIRILPLEVSNVRLIT